MFSVYSYKSRSEIMKTNNAILNYRVLEYNCRGGLRGSSTIKINYNSKDYYVSLNHSKCKDLKNNNSKLELYYDDSLDIVFHESGLNKKIVILFGCTFVFFILFWFVPRKYW